jgi:Trypsin-like peptidase domain/NACHT domain
VVTGMAGSVQYHEMKGLEELLSYSVIHVDKRGTHFSGTGFSIDDRLAITCAHLFTGPNRNGEWTEPPLTTTLVWQGMEGHAKVHCLRTQKRQDLPDLAFLEDVTWDGPVNIPSVMLGNDWDPDSEYYAFGYPGGIFEKGDSLIFKYSGTDSIHTNGTSYKKMQCPFPVTAGFSGSPILNRAKGRVCGLVAITLNESAAVGIRAVPVSYAIEHLPDLIERQHGLHRRTMWWPNLTPGGIFWQDAEQACAALSSHAAKTVGGASDHYYQPRAIEKDICRFFKNEFVGMFIVGKSGMGKTTLLARLARQEQKSGNLFAMINSVELTLDLRELEKDIAEKLGLVDTEKHKHIQTQFWKALDEEAGWRGQQVFLCIDAVNEYNQGKESPRPVMLLDCLDKLAIKLSESTHHIKIMVTCRPETWRQALNTLSRRLGNSNIYYQPTPEIAWTLPMFTQDEFPGAYAKYSHAGSLKTSYEDLSGLAKYHLRDPFLLKLAESAFRNREVPREFDTGDLFKDYIGGLKEGGLLDLVEELVGAMFLDDDTRAPIAGGEEIKRTAIQLNEALATSRPNLHRELDFKFKKDLSKGFELREKNVIREWDVRDESGEPVTQIRFTYDRFAEYMLSKRLALMIFKREKKGEAIAAAAQAVIGVNLNASQRMAIVSGAIQRTLISLKSEKSQYAEILRSVAQIDARGQWIVISVLARTAKNVDGGIELLTSLLDELSQNDPGSDRRFPVIDAVYRVLRDEDYRLWLDEQTSSVRERHLEVLHGYFLAGFKSDDLVVFTAAIQYLFFLWKASSVRGFEDGWKITRRLVDKVKPLALMAIKKQSRSLLRGLAAVLLLILPEALEPRFSEAIELSGETIRRLKLPGLGEKAAFLLNTVLIDYFLKILDQLPNPIQLASLNHYFKNQDLYQSDAEEVISLLRQELAKQELTVDTFKRLTRNDNSFIVQMLTFVLSTRYERATSDEERAIVLQTIEQCFFAEPRCEISEYCSSLSVYHINCFGSHATNASMDLMGRMASAILSERKGRLTISGKRHNFNIIGTYGRALHQNENIVSSQGAMQYALDALRQARELEDSEYYLYICENLGLLGVLVEPKYLFEVFTAILKEVRVLDVDGSFQDLPFDCREIAAARNTIMQSLANIRVLYREQVDKYLLEVLESPELYAEIANERTPDFKLSFFFSWSFEQLMFRCFVSHYETMGSKVLDAFLDAVRGDSASAASRIVLAKLFNHVAGLSR